MPAHAHAQRASPAARQPDRVEGHGHRLLLRRSHARPLDLGPGHGRAEESRRSSSARLVERTGTAACLAVADEHNRG